MMRKTRKTAMRPDAILFDFDGVIADTEPLHWKAFSEVLRPLGKAFSWRKYVSDYLGFDDRGVFRAVFSERGEKLSALEMGRLVKSKAAVFERLASSRAIGPYPGVVSLIRAARRAGVPLALCTGALRRDIRPLLRCFNMARVFQVIVTAEDVHESKPDPRAYRLALQRLRARFPARRIVAARCVAIEDTPAGIAAARGAGLRVLAVTNTYSRRALRGAEAIVDSLREVTLEQMGAHVLKQEGGVRTV